VIDRLFSDNWLNELVDGVRPGWQRLRESMAYPVAVSEEELQRKLETLFPRSGRRAGCFWSASGPVLTLESNGTGKLWLRLELVIAGVTLRGNGVMRSGLDYRPAERAFYLKNPWIETLVLAGVSLPWVPLKKRLQTSLAKWAEQHPVYRLDADSRQHQWLRQILERVEVRQPAVCLILSPQIGR